MLNINLAQAATGVLLGLGLGVARSASARFRSRVRNAARSKFWSRPSQRAVDLVLTGYDVDDIGRGQDLAIAKSATGHRLVSTGMARAIATIQQFAHADMNSSRISVHDEASTEMLDADSLLIILGSEANNDLAKHYMERIRREFDLPYRFIYNVEHSRIELCDREYNTAYAPERQNGEWKKDFALIVRTRLTQTPSRDLLIISGCHMWGTWSAAMAVTDARWMREFSKSAGGVGGNEVILIETDIVAGRPQGAHPVEWRMLKRTK